MNGNTIDFLQHSDTDLESAFFYIDQDQHPQNREACLNEIRRRQTSGHWPASNANRRPHHLNSKAARATSIVLGAFAFFAVLLYGHPAVSTAAESALRWQSSVAEYFATLFPMFH